MLTAITWGPSHNKHTLTKLYRAQVDHHKVEKDMGRLEGVLIIATIKKNSSSSSM